MFSASSLARVSPAGWYQSNGPAGIAALYVALQFGYSLWAKQYVVLDVIAVAIGFVLTHSEVRSRCGSVAVARLHYLRAGDVIGAHQAPK